MADIFGRTKPLPRILAEGSDVSKGLKRTLGPWTLTAMGIGAIIGTGIFVLTGVASATRSGPSLTLSFVVAGIVSALAALCYSEVSSKIPIAGSAYSYAYATFGEFLASDFILAAGGSLYDVRESHTEFDEAAIFLVRELFAHNARLIQQFPEHIAAARVVMAHARGLFTRIAAHNYEAHSGSQIVRQSPHRSFPHAGVHQRYHGPCR